MKKYIFILILNALLLNCDSKQEVQSVNLIIDIDDLNELTVTPDIFIKNSTYVQLETKDNFLIGNNIEKLLVSNNMIFLLDSNHKIFVFETTGKFFKYYWRKRWRS